MDNDNPRVRAIKGEMVEEAVDKEVSSLLILSLGESSRKMFKDSHPELSIWTLPAGGMMENCTNCFHFARNRTLDRHSVLSRKQQATESFQQFWHALKGLACTYELG